MQEVEVVDLYAVLGLKKNASQEQIKTAYRSLAKVHHPDLARDNPHSKPEVFKEINEAYAILGDENKRRDYDLEQARIVDAIRAKNEGNAWTAEGDEQFRRSRFTAANKLRADVTQRGYENRQHRQKVNIPTQKQTYWRMTYPVAILGLWAFNYWYFHATF